MTEQQIDAAFVAFKAELSRQGHNVEWDWGEGKVLIDAVFNLREVLRIALDAATQK